VYNAPRHTQLDVPLKPRLYRHPHGISAVDAEYLYPGHAAAHIIVESGRAAFVDVGTNASVPYLLAALAELGIARAAVDFVLLTHVHLDHAGGAGRLMRELPNAQAVLHPRGAPHMIDPTKLIAGSRAVYGEERLQRLYGQLVPIPSSRVRVIADGERVSLAGRTLAGPHLEDLRQRLRTGGFAILEWENRAIYGKARLAAALEGLRNPGFAETLALTAA